uniref:RNA-directed DNA polymerase from mobile element jockey n=1 Tax=Lygus hesperus TaxID=30085 RepID=A0A0A9Y6A7_LYGHE
MCDRKEIEYYQDIGNRLERVTCPKDYWAIVSSFKLREVVVDPQIAGCIWYEHFKALLNPSRDVGSIAYARPLVTIERLDKPFELWELKCVLNKAKANKAPGPDQIPYEFFKGMDVECLQILLNFFNEVFESDEAPKSFGRSVIFPLFKKVARNIVNNYRGISFMNTLAKVYAGLLLERLSLWMEEEGVLNEYQAGFRKNFSTIDNIFNLTSLVKIKLRIKRSRVYAFFIDFASVFDRVNREYLWYKLSREGVSTKFINALSRLYAHTESAVKLANSSTTEYFATCSGVKQGCLLSPSLFALYLNDLHDFLTEGVWVGDREVRHLSFADDVILLASSVVGLQRMIDRMEEYCRTWGLELNLSKSKIMVFRNGGRPSEKEKWHFADRMVDVVVRYKYLGYTLTPTLTPIPHLEEKSSMAKLAITSMWKQFLSHPKIPFTEKMKVFDAVVRSILCYSSQVWGFVLSDHVESVLRFFIKMVFSLPKCTPNYILYLETQLKPLYLYTLRMHFSYILKVMKMPSNRLPNYLAKKCVELDVYWAKEWRSLYEKYGTPLLNFENLPEWKTLIEGSLHIIERAMCAEFQERALCSRNHPQYLALRLESDVVPLSQFKDFQFCRWLFKIRGDLLALRYRPYSTDNQACVICSSGEIENCFHFIGRLGHYFQLEIDI